MQYATSFNALHLILAQMGHPPLERQHCLSLWVTYWSAPLPATRCCPDIVENSFPGDRNRWYLWCLSVVLTWWARSRRVFVRFP